METLAPVLRFCGGASMTYNGIKWHACGYSLHQCQNAEACGAYPSQLSFSFLACLLCVVFCCVYGTLLRQSKPTDLQILPFQSFQACW
jgi:hypothetical protein